VLPASWSHGNPVDVLGDATPKRFAQALEIVAGGVLTVVGELHAEPVHGALVQAADRALDHAFGT